MLFFLVRCPKRKTNLRGSKDAAILAYWKSKESDVKPKVMLADMKPIFTLKDMAKCDQENGAKFNAKSIHIAEPGDVLATES